MSEPIKSNLTLADYEEILRPIYEPPKLSNGLISFATSKGYFCMSEEEFRKAIKKHIKKVKAVCKVCELLDNDKTEKPIVYCNFCDASMCEPCERNWYRRGLAMIKQKTNGKSSS